MKIQIGVTGHRKLADVGLMRQRTLEALRVLENDCSSPPLDFEVISPLAEGADRIVAESVLSHKASLLEAVLPLPVDDYMQDFTTEASRDEFLCLLAKASSILVLEGAGSRDEAYERVGRYVVDHCDVLIAIWNKRPANGRGGTAEIVEYARDIGRPMIIIDSNDGTMSD